MPQLTSIMDATWLHWIGLALSVITAVGYFLLVSPMRPAGYLSPPRPVLIVAGLAYLVGGTLILTGDRQLLLIGAIVNLIVLAAFFAASRFGRATVDGLSLGGKVAQVALEVVLIWLIVRPA